MNINENKELILAVAYNVHVLKPFNDKVLGKVRYAVFPHSDPEKSSCIWAEPVKGLEADIIERVGEYNARHTYGHPSLFKPSLFEVVRYAPEEMLGKFNAVTVDYAGLDGDKHISRVTMYNVNIDVRI